MNLRRRLNISTITPAMVLVGLGWLCMYLPTYRWLSDTIWRSDDQGHGPIILALSAFLLFKRRDRLLALAPPISANAGYVLVALGCLFYLLGRSQSIYILDVGSQLVVLAGIVVAFRGASGLKVALFPIAFLAFMVPLPSGLVAAVTAPLKIAVSTVASSLLYDMGYPVARSGVMLSIGQYQLLVADACAGLNSMFTLEALGLLYMNVMEYKSLKRNICLAMLIVPISFCANVVRVLSLILVTYYFGDEVGQGFAHQFAGLILFAVALVLILAADKLLGYVLSVNERKYASVLP